MKAIVQDTYGSADVLEVRDIDKPAVGHDDVPLCVHAAGVNPGVWHAMTGRPYLMRVMVFGLRRPKSRIRGTDVAGRVEAVGKGVANLQPYCGRNGQDGRGSTGRPGVEKMISVMALMLRLP